MVYLILVILGCVGIAVFDGRRLSRTGLLCYWLLGLLSVLVAGLRYRVGMDTVFDEYLVRSSVLDPGLFADDIRERFSPVYMMLVKLSGHYTDAMWPVQMIMSAWLGLAVFCFGYFNRKAMGGRLFLYATLYLAVWFIRLNFESAREGMAVGFFLFAWHQLRQGRYWWYILLSLCASVCHRFGCVTLLFWVSETGWFKTLYCGREMKFGVRNAVAVFLTLAVGIAVRYLLLTVIPGMDLAAPYDKFFRNVSVEVLNWRGMAGVAVITIVYPIAAMLLLRRANAAVMMSVLIMTAGLGIQAILRIFYYLCFFCIVEVVKCVAERRNIMPGYIWVLCFVPLVAVLGYNYSKSQEWPDGEQHREYEIYQPYEWVLTGDRDIGRELYCISKFDVLNYHAVLLMSEGFATTGKLTPEEEEWLVRMYERTRVDGNDFSEVEEYMRTLRVNTVRKTGRLENGTDRNGE